MAALPPGSTIGILGAGQLGRMLAAAAVRLGLKTHVYADAPGPAFDVATETTVGAFEDLGHIRAFAERCDAVTYEFENVPLGAAAAAAAVRPLRPGARALEVAQDRLIEKQFVAGLGLPVAPFAAVESRDDLDDALATIGTPAILKTTRYGYDGKGQVRLVAGADPAWALAAIANRPAVLEGFVSFAFEVSVLLVRGLDGEIRFYDIPTNTHADGILATSTVPSALPPAVIARAHAIAERIATALGYVGVLAVEMFYLGEGAPEPLVVNEFAPRVHNSGHWTLDACLVSQFENHVRAVAGWPLGSTRRHSDAVMENLIGAAVEPWRQLAAEEGAALHLYGKHEARAGRKMGHVTRLKPLKAQGR
jgi:5-(carboxyamino)imidazole ribonucleotide synthase